MYRATEAVVAQRASLIEDLNGYRSRWARLHPEDEQLPAPDLRTAATLVAVSRTKATAEARGVWP
jgi:hypothetical protein